MTVVFARTGDWRVLRRHHRRGQGYPETLIDVLQGNRTASFTGACCNAKCCWSASRSLHEPVSPRRPCVEASSVHVRGLHGKREGTETVIRPPNDTPNQLRAATRAKSDAARQLPRLTIALAEAICNCRDAVAQMPPRRGSAGPANGRASAALGS
jgi:hypothetical protein